MRRTCSNEPLKKQKTIMKTKNMILAALSMTAALVMTACSSDDNMVETPATLQTKVKTIPYTVTVGQGGDAATTRATVDADNKTLRFATGDKLYITGTNIKGVLTIQSGVGGASDATFSGNLTYSGEGSPASVLTLTATLVSAQQTVGSEVSVDAAGAVTVNYPTTVYCDDVVTAVQKYSNLTGTSTYGAKSFDLTQQTAFLNFEITFTEGTTAGTALSAVVKKDGSNTLCTANVTTKNESEKVVAKFVLPVASGTTLSGATVTMGDKGALAINNATLEGKVYNVKRETNVLNGKFSVSDTKKVKFSKGNLRYASGAWSFFDNQYDYYTSHSADAWDHFGWSTSATDYGMNTSTSADTYSGNFKDWGGNSDLQTALGTGWFTLSKDEWTYLFNTRSASTVNITANGRYAKAKVNNVQGVILFPDTYTHPDGVTAPTGVNATGNTGWNSNSYSSADWTKMESAGCVFLPAAGYRDGSSVNLAGTYGYCWSASSNGADGAYSVRFTSGTLNPAYSSYRDAGYSVRLVRQVE